MESRDVQQKRENQPHNANLIKSHFFLKKQEKESILEETFAASRRKRVSGRNRKTGNGPVCPWRPLRGSWAVTANGVNKYFWACLWACCEDLKLLQERSRVICLYGGEVSVFRFHESVKHRRRRYNCALFDQGLLGVCETPEPRINT